MKRFRLAREDCKPQRHTGHREAALTLNSEFVPVWFRICFVNPGGDSDDVFQKSPAARLDCRAAEHSVSGRENSVSFARGHIQVMRPQTASPSSDG